MYDLRDLTIRSISVSKMDNNVYALTAKASGAQVLIDAADNAAAVLDLLSSASADTPAELKPTLVITTHSHWDHVRALADVVSATGMKTAAGSADIADIPVPTDVPLEHGDIGNFDGFHLEAIALRGHTPGSIAILYRDPEGPPHLFTGDSLFPGGVGNTGGDPDRFRSLYTDVEERVFKILPDETIVHPGHGKPTTLGAERPHLEEWRSRGW